MPYAFGQVAQEHDLLAHKTDLKLRARALRFMDIVRVVKKKKKKKAMDCSVDVLL